MQKNKTQKSFLNFSWGSGAQLAIWPYGPKAKKTLDVAKDRPREVLQNGSILTNLQDFDKNEWRVNLPYILLIKKIIEAFAKNLHDFSTAKAKILNSDMSPYLIFISFNSFSEKKRDEIFFKSQEANFVYLSAIKNTVEQCKNTDFHKVSILCIFNALVSRLFGKYH